MAPIVADVSPGVENIKKLLGAHRVVVFSKTTCPFCDNVKNVFAEMRVEVKYVELDQMQEGPQVQQVLAEMTGQTTVPNMFVNSRHLGGSDDLASAIKSGKLSGLLALTKEDVHNYDYDIIVIGGGSGGLAASKEAARLGRKVAVCDFVMPSPPGTTWGLGGTCVNVGCIPKKLMHQASLLGEFRKDSAAFGWAAADGGGEDKVDWVKMVDAIQNHIKSLNWGYKVALTDKKVKYLNEYASFVDAHTLKTINKKGKESKVTANYFILATGGRPKYPDIPGAKEFGITSDDLFSLSYNPGKTLLVGASYISLECAGFLHGIGIPSTVMVRSILLRGFDQQLSNKIGEYMETEGIHFIRQCVPTKLELIEKAQPGQPGLVKVMAKYDDGTSYEDTFNTVIFAVGRDAETTNINLMAVNVKVNPENQKVIHNDHEQTSVPNIYAIGDVLDGKPELTPVAIHAGILLARRLCHVDTVLTDYVNVPTTVFTPLEYGCVGLAEEAAVEKYGEADVEVYHKNVSPLEWTVPHRDENVCYAKLVCLKSDGERVIGFHYLGPNAGEVTQGYAGMIMMGAKKVDFDRLIGIHPTTAEVFTTMDITKRSGVDAAATGC